MDKHILDENPKNNGTKPIYINEPWLIDRSLEWMMVEGYSAEPLPDEDNVRVYIPMDISSSSILRRLERVIQRYGEVSFWNNESDYSCDVYCLVSQIEIYDQYWLSNGSPSDGRHTCKTRELVKELVEKLKAIPEGDGEIFPYNVIEELTGEYLI